MVDGGAGVKPGGPKNGVTQPGMKGGNRGAGVVRQAQTRRNLHARQKCQWKDWATNP